MTVKLAFICSEKLPSPAVKGGAVQVMLDGILPFLNRNHQITIFSITDPTLKEREIQDSIEYIRCPRENYETKVAEELKKHRFDVIHVFNRPKNIMLYKTAAPDSTFVLSLHNDMFSPMKISRKEGLKVIENVSAITTVSKYIRRTVIGRYPQAAPKLHVLYSGLDLSQYAPAWTEDGQKIRKEMREKYQVEKKKVILYIGRLDTTKGPHLLINALQYLIPKYPDIVLVLVGGKWFSDNTRDEYVLNLYQLAKKYDEHVLFTQYIPADKIPEIMVMGDVFVCSSQWNEPLARVHYEAMAAGIPIITTNRGGNTEVMNQGKNGIIIHEYDQPKAYFKAIDVLLQEPAKAEEMAKSGRAYVENRYQYQHVVATLEKVYYDAVKKQSRKN